MVSMHRAFRPTGTKKAVVSGSLLEKLMHTMCGCTKSECTSVAYLAYATLRISRITVTFTWPGYCISRSIF